MKNKVIDKEHEKAKRFFQKLYDKSVLKSVSWFLNGIFLFLMMLICLMPIQELLAEEDSPLLIPGVLTMFSFMLVNTWTMPYKQYGENQKSRTMQEILQYYPVSKKAIWKHKMSELISFLSKVTGVGLILQILVSLIACKTLSWMNFAYVIGCVFCIPVLGELVFDSIMEVYKED